MFTVAVTHCCPYLTAATHCCPYLTAADTHCCPYLTAAATHCCHYITADATLSCCLLSVGADLSTIGWTCLHQLKVNCISLFWGTLISSFLLRSEQQYGMGYAGWRTEALELANVLLDREFISKVVFRCLSRIFPMLNVYKELTNF
ncbi:uncharacterized protein LOC122072159 [Macadamia integrifolia]|uniref:uncharacterized protein LOC122072159 n=1 Tax=Macadamia integrifolia TaxID=60698 RepID=UPI001C4FFCDB|nr:uncharacterized protein LOC122072159 [Macadamia integrifolia]